ncbi:MAG: M56 family metallopeptidase [Bdellovibrio sp.]|jgi:beta-lactamase regulating signal transducer with metallopeptidase domain
MSLSILDFAWRLFLVAGISSSVMFAVFLIVRPWLLRSGRVFSSAAKLTALSVMALIFTSALLVLFFDQEWSARCFGLFAQEHETWGITRWVGMGWFAVAGGLLFRDVRRHQAFVKNVFKNSKLAEYELVRASGRTLSLQIRVTEQHVTPFCVGLFNPSIVIPSELFKQESKALDIIVHEYAHRLHRDGVWSALVLLVQRLCWFNPLVFVFARSYRLAIELAADQRAVKSFGLDPRHYAETLISVLQSHLGPLTSPLAVSSVLDFKQLEVRFRHLQTLESTDHAPWKLKMSLAVLFLGTGLGWQQALASMNLKGRSSNPGYCAQAQHERKIETWLLIESANLAPNKCESTLQIGSLMKRCE